MNGGDNMVFEKSLDFNTYPYIELRLGKSVKDISEVKSGISREFYNSYLNETQEYFNTFVEDRTGYYYKTLFKNGYIPLCLNPTFLASPCATEADVYAVNQVTKHLAEFKSALLVKLQEAQLPYISVKACNLTPSVVAKVTDSDIWVHRLDAKQFLNIPGPSVAV